MPRIQYPNVPKLPGVPQVLRSPQFPAAPPVGLSQAFALGSVLRAFLFGTGWGIYKHQSPTEQDPTTGVERFLQRTRRTPVVKPDSFLEFAFRNEWVVNDAPVQASSNSPASFAAFNKVDTPYNVVLRMAKGGSQSDREAFLKSIHDIAGDTNLYDIVTPERSYLNVNIERFEVVRRGKDGAYFLTDVDLYFREIRFVTPQYLTTTASGLGGNGTAATGVLDGAQQPSAQPVQNNGAVQGQGVNDGTATTLEVLITRGVQP